MATVTCQEEHPDFCGGVTWESLAWPLFWWPIISQALVTLVAMPLFSGFWLFSRWRRSTVWQKLYSLTDSNVEDYFGRKVFWTICCVTEITTSTYCAIIWVVQSYTKKVPPTAYWLEFLACIFLSCIYMANAARHNFQVVFALYPSSFITVATTTAAFGRGWVSESSRWFGWGYLRIYNAVRAYRYLHKKEYLPFMNDVQRSIVLLFFESVALVVICAGTVFNLEILGPLPGLTDSYVKTDMGDISFFQMVYWIFTTISTVGYGDFSPTTAVSRFCIIIIIVGGTVFFSVKTIDLLELMKLEDSGRGQYIPLPGFVSWLLFHQRKRGYVVIVGGGVSQWSQVMGPLLSELLSEDNMKIRKEGWPDISIMSPVEKPAALSEFLEDLPRKAQCRVGYYVGNPMDRADMNRVRMQDASTVFVIANVHAQNVDLEDHDNIMRTLAITHAYPKVMLRLMLLRPGGKGKAVRVGIRANRCFSVNEMKSALFAVSCSCRGWSSMILNMLSTSATLDVDDGSDWTVEYAKGQTSRIRGFSVKGDYVKMTFLEFSKKLAKHGIMPLAVQIEGKVVVRPLNHKLQSNQIVFALASKENSATLDEFQDDNTEWRETFWEDRVRASASSSHLEAPNDIISQASTFSKLISKTNSLSKTNNALDKSGRPEHGEEHSHAASHARAHGLIQGGNHYILVVLSEVMAPQQVQNFLRAVHREHLPYTVPSIILAHGEPLSHKDVIEITHGLPDVAIRFLDHRASIDDLVRAGLLSAKGVVLLTGNPGPSRTEDYDLPDSLGVTLFASIEFEFMKEQIPCLPIILELISPNSIASLSLYPEMETDMAALSPASRQNTTPTPTKARKLDFSGQKITGHPRFASGSVLPTDCLGALLAHAYYNPGTVELIEALVVDHHGTEAVQPWQVALPPGHNLQTYGDLTQYFLEEHAGALCVGIYRTRNKLVDGMHSVRKTAHTRRVSYVYTNPHPSTLLRSDDLVIVLGNAQFGEQHYKANLIPNALHTDFDTSCLDAPEKTAL